MFSPWMYPMLNYENVILYSKAFFSWMLINLTIVIRFAYFVALRSAIHSLVAYLALIPIVKYFGKDMPGFLVVFGLFAFLRVLYLMVFDSAQDQRDADDEDIYFDELEEEE